MVEWVLGGIAIAASAVAAYAMVRYRLLRRALGQANRDLSEIVEAIEENRILHLAHPDRDLEALLATINRALDITRTQAVLYARRNAELKARVERISHDLRTPLTSILGYLALIDAGALDESSAASLATVERKARTLQRLIAQFYELSYLQGEDYEVVCEPIDAGRAVREAVASRYRLLDERSLDVDLSIPEHPLRAIGNADALERVLENLLDNAGKYAKSRLSVLATVDQATGRIAIEFANDAEGLENLDVAQLFEPFYTADASRTQESSGLGLAIARSLSERMGGSIGARAETRDGTSWLVFSIELAPVP